MPNYRVELTHQAERGLRQIAKGEPALYARVLRVIGDLGRDPFQGKALKGELKGRYSYRIGSYRIIYTIRHRELLIIVIDIGHRRDIYH